MLDAIYDFNRVNPAWVSSLRPSRILVDSPLPEGESVLSIKQSRINFLGFIPTSAGELKTRFEFDLYGVGPDEGQTTMRVRHVYGEIGKFLFGQTNSVFMDGDIFPNTIEYWGPVGMVFLRTPQARYIPINKNGRTVAVAVESASTAVDSGKVDQIDPTLGLRGRTQWPDFTAQYRQAGGRGHFQIAGILRSVGFESATSPTGEPEGQETGYGLSVGGTYKAFKRDKVYAQLTYGKGISNYMNDFGNDLGPTAALDAEALTSYAWVLYYEHPWNEKWVSSIGYSIHRQDNSSGQTADAGKKGSYFTVNALYTAVANTLLGVEVQWGERENKGGARGQDTRIQFSAKYNFNSH
jgi:hypothetical protein